MLGAGMEHGARGMEEGHKALSNTPCSIKDWLGITLPTD
jgi:hypothetical protein